MADGKRQSAAGKVATPKIGPSMNELDAALSKAVGTRIRVTTSLPNTVLEGTLFTACPVTNMIAINTATPPPNPASALASQPGDYHLIPISQIQSFQLLSLPTSGDRVEGSGPGFEGALPSIGRVDLDALRAREEAAIRKLKEKDALRSKGVGKEAQEIFEAFARQLPTRWHDASIVVNDAVIIKAPYRLEDCIAPKEKQNSLPHVKKILENYYRKKTSQGGNRPAAVTPITPRKGG